MFRAEQITLPARHITFGNHRKFNLARDLIVYLATNLTCYSLWIVFSAYGKTLTPSGSSFPIFFAGYLFAGCMWVLVGRTYLGWTVREATHRDFALFGLAGVLACSGTVFMYRALAEARPNERPIVFTTAASYLGVVFLIAVIACFVYLLLAAYQALPASWLRHLGEFAKTLGFDPASGLTTGKLWRVVGVALAVGGILILAWHRESK